MGDEGSIDSKECMDVWIWEEIDGYMDRQIDGCRVGRWKDEWMNGLMDNE